MPYNKRKQKCKQSDGDAGSYVLSYTDKKGKKHSACHTSKKKMQGQIAAIEAEADELTGEQLEEDIMKLSEKRLRALVREDMRMSQGEIVNRLTDYARSYHEDDRLNTSSIHTLLQDDFLDDFGHQANIDDYADLLNQLASDSSYAMDESKIAKYPTNTGVRKMKISKNYLKRLIREERAKIEECPMDDDMSVAVVDVMDVGAPTVAESIEPEQQVMVEMQMASRALDQVVESIQSAAQLCPDCVDEVAAVTPLVEALTAQAEALQETVNAVGAVVVESAETTADVDMMNMMTHLK